MKKLLIVAICVAGVLSAQAQGLINFLNISGSVTTVSGALAAGETLGQLWAGTAADSLAAVGDPLAFVGGGTINGGEVAIPGVAGGSTAFVQLRAWDAASGADYASATIKGESNVATSPALKTAGALLPAPFLNTDAFQLADVGGPVIPEPSTVALAILGAAGLFIRRRK
jgi:hypothetical protein